MILLSASTLHSLIPDRGLSSIISLALVGLASDRLALVGLASDRLALVGLASDRLALVGLASDRLALVGLASDRLLHPLDLAPS